MKQNLIPKTHKLLISETAKNRSIVGKKNVQDVKCN